MNTGEFHKSLITQLQNEVNGYKIAQKDDISHFTDAYNTLYSDIRNMSFKSSKLVSGLEDLAKDINNDIIIDGSEKIDLTLIDNLKPTEQGGGKKSKKQPKKEILGVMRCIYKIPGDRKEYVKHKGKLITIKDFKEFMKPKKQDKPKKLTKPKKQTKAKKQTKTK